MNLRRLNSEGLKSFEAYLVALRDTPSLPPPTEFLCGDATSEEIASISVEPRPFVNRFEAGRWLYDVIEQANLIGPARDKGMWAWLSLIFFDSVCPTDGNGRRKPGEIARHIPDVANFQRYYRHLLAGPWRIVRAHRDAPERALAVLCQPLDKPGDIVEQLASRQELVTNRAFISAATALYVDAASKQPRRGSGGKTRGAPRRLADFCNQLDVTWDLYAMESEEIIDKLPKEFDRFR